MNIYIYSDESGVLDKRHNSVFVFGGLMFLSKESKNTWERKYLYAENIIRQSEDKSAAEEIKAFTVSNKAKGKLYRALNQVEKFGVVIDQTKLYDEVFEHKKTRQRYLDWAFKMAVKRKFEALITRQIINPDDVKSLCFYVDEHSTATNGRYELRESMEQEFKLGTFNWEYLSYHPPLFKNLSNLDLAYCDSKTVTLIRSADIVANHLYHSALTNNFTGYEEKRFDLFFHP